MNSKPAAAHVRRIVRVALLVGGAAFVFLGLVWLDRTSPAWLAATLVLYCLPLAAVAFDAPAWLTSAAFTITSLIAIQTAFTLWRPPGSGDYFTLPPCLSYDVDVREGIPGISGRQHVSTDWRGFRTNGNVDYWRKKKLRVIVVGGSTAEQIYLDDRRTFTQLLEESLTARLGRPVEVINTGVSGLRARHHLATLERAVRLHPDLVIFLIGLNDWNVQISSHFLSGGDSYPFDPNPPRAAPPAHGKWSDLSNTDLVRDVAGAYALWERLGGPPKLRIEHGRYYTVQRGSLQKADRRMYHPNGVSAEYRYFTHRISDVCSEHRINCLFLTQPSGYHEGIPDDYAAGFWMTPPNQPYTLDLDSMIYISRLYNTYLMGLAQPSAGIFSFDLAGALPVGWETCYDDCHYNESGARKVAAALVDPVAAILRRK